MTCFDPNRFRNLKGTYGFFSPDEDVFRFSEIDRGDYPGVVEYDAFQTRSAHVSSAGYFADNWFVPDSTNVIENPHGYAAETFSRVLRASRSADLSIDYDYTCRPFVIVLRKTQARMLPAFSTALAFNTDGTPDEIYDLLVDANEPVPLQNRQQRQPQPKRTEHQRMSDFFFGKQKPPSGNGGGFMGLDSFNRRRR